MPFTNILTNTLDTAIQTAENVNEIIPEDIYGKLIYGLKITLLGMGMVFLVLILLMIVLYLFKLCFYTIPNKVKANKKKPNKKSVVNKNETEAGPSGEDDGELIAILTAAIATYEGNSDATSRYRIRSFKRI